MKHLLTYPPETQTGKSLVDQLQCNCGELTCRDMVALIETLFSIGFGDDTELDDVLQSEGYVK